MIKKTLKIAGIILLLLIAFAFSAPFLFSGKIKSIIKSQINERLTAKVDFSGLDISLFRNFPRLAVALDDLSVTGTGEFSGDTLLSAKRIDVALNLLSVISGDQIKIHSISTDQPRVHALVNRDGHPNWAITKPDTSTAAKPDAATPAKPFRLALQKYTISDAYIEYRDEPGNMRCEISGLNHSGSGDFSSDQFLLQTRTNTQELSFTYGGIPYLVRTRANALADLQIDNKSAKYSFAIDDLSVNDVKLKTEGFFQLLNDSTYNMDIKFNGPSLDFRSVLSLIPAMYKKDFASIKTSGEASLSGFVKGVYDSKHIPAYHVGLEVKNGNFQYPDLPKPVKNINFILKADNPDGITDHTVVDIPQCHLEMEETPFDLRLLLKTPVSDPYIDAAAKGRLDLAKVTQFVKLDKSTRLNGLLNADLSAAGNLSAIEKREFDRFRAAGTLALTNFLYASPAYPDGVNLENLLLTFNPKQVTLNDLKGGMGKTHFQANGSLNNLLGWMLKNQTLDGSLTAKADLLNLNDWMPASPADSASANKTASQATTKSGKDSAAAPFAVPANIRFQVTAAVDQVIYNKLNLQNLTGNLKIADETVVLENAKGNGLGGAMTINGAYSTKQSKKNPSIAFAYDVKGLDIQQAFYAFNTMQKIMPVGKFINGKFSSHMTMSGSMGPGNTPDMSTLSGEGNILLAEGALKNFAPTDKLSQVLHLDELKDIPLKDLKTNFSFRNGRVIVDPFHIRWKDIDIETGGSHGFDQTLDYTANVSVPRSYLGGDVNNALNSANALLASQGLQTKVKDQLLIPVKIGGSLNNPQVKADLNAAAKNAAGDVKQQALDLVKARVDSARKQLKDTAVAVGKQALKDAGNELKNQLLGKKDSTTATSGQEPVDAKKKAEEAGKNLLNNLFNKKKG